MLTKTRSVNLFGFAILLFIGLFSLTASISIRADAQVAQPTTRRYTSQPLGFEVDLPEDWTVNEYRNVGSGYSFMSAGPMFDSDGQLLRGAYITIGASQAVSDPTTLTPQGAKISGKWLNVGRKPALRYVPAVPDRDSRIAVDAYRDDTLYRFTLHFNAQDSQQDAYKVVFESILRSLVFISRHGDLPTKEAATPVASLAHPALDLPFSLGTDWEIAGGGGYHNQNLHEGYAQYALDFIRNDGNMVNELVLSPTSGKLTHKETTTANCFDISIDQVNSTDDLYLQICHVVWETDLVEGSNLQKAQILGRVAQPGEPGFVNTPHIHIAAFTGRRGNPWIDLPRMIAVPFTADLNLSLSGTTFYPNGSINQFGGTCCYRSSMKPPILLAVTPAGYDDIGAVLSRPELGYSWTQIQLADLANYTLLSQYDAVFINCSSSVQSTPQIVSALKQYVQNGGSVYASDWAYIYVSNTFPGYIGFRSAPRIGYGQYVNATIVDPGLASYLEPSSPPSSITLNYNLSNWAVIDDVSSNTKVHLRGSYNTSSGQMANKPLAVSFSPYPTSTGRVIYTTFHNEAQQSALEKKLLEYLVLIPSTSQLAAQAEQVVTSNGLYVKQTNINTINPGATSPLFTYNVAVTTKLILVSNWGGSTLRLSVFQPDGTLYSQVESGAPPAAIAISNAQPGAWKYQVSGISVPYANYPYVVAIGDQF